MKLSDLDPVYRSADILAGIVSALGNVLGREPTEKEAELAVRIYCAQYEPPPQLEVSSTRANTLPPAPNGTMFEPMDKQL